MISKTTRRFREAYGRLPEHVQRRAREAYRRFKDKPEASEPPLQTVHATQPVYSARVGLGSRALAIIDGEVVVWFWIGTHAEFDQLVRTL